MPKLLFAAMAACALVPFAGQAMAEPARAVSTAGVDFRDPDAVEVLYGRLHDAAVAVCDSYVETSRVTQADVACEEQTLAKAVASIDRSQLYANYERRHPGVRPQATEIRRADASESSTRN